MINTNMSKTIIFCADGTWDGPEDATGESVLDSDNLAQELAATALTNVVKLYANLQGATLPSAVALENEDEKILADPAGNPLQVAKYLHGVGDSKNLLVKLLGGIFGLGVVARIVRGYTFLSRYYAPGDRIHICGFSRGAYTARALTGVIAQVGLLDPATYDPADKEHAYRLGIAAWAKAKTLQLNGKGKMTQLASDIISVFERFLAAPLDPQNLRPEVPVSSVAVWDTVGSLGIPEYVKGARADVFRFVDAALSPKVEQGLHAMAIDELRVDFPVTKWDARAGITQTWFIGAHGDVGGGYSPAESSLSDLTLEWMTGQLAALGVGFAATPVYRPDASRVLTQPIHTPWTQPPFDHLGRAPRVPAPGDDFHPSIQARRDIDPTYRPATVPAG